MMTLFDLPLNGQLMSLIIMITPFTMITSPVVTHLRGEEGATSSPTNGETSSPTNPIMAICCQP